MTAGNLGRAVCELQPGDHLCLIYDHDPMEQFPALLPYIQQGLDAGEQCVYLAADQPIEQVAAVLASGGIDVDAERGRGALVLLEPDVLATDVTGRLEQISGMVDAAPGAGFTGIRFAAEMTWILSSDMDAAALERVEAALSTIIRPERAVRMICQYNRARLAPEVIEASLRTHPRVALGTDVCINLFYDAPLFLDGIARQGLDETLAPSSDRDAAARRVDWMIAQLRWAREVEREREARIRAEAAASEAIRAREEIEHLYRQTAEQAALLNIVNRIARIVASEMDLDRAIRGVTDAATGATRARFGAFFCRPAGEPADRCELRALSGGEPDSFDALRWPRDAALLDLTLQRGKSLRVRDVLNDPRYRRSAPVNLSAGARPAMRSYLAIPVISRSNEILGGIFLGHPKPGLFGETDQVIVRAIAKQAAIVIDNARLLEQARRAVEIREEFLGIASHELKTPMTVVKGYAMMLARKLRRGVIDPQELSSAVDELVGASDRLEKLVNDLLDTSRIQTERLELHPEPVDLARVASEVVQRFEGDPMFTSRHRLVLDAPEPVIGLWDPGRIDQVLTNLVSNALKYSPGGGEARVTVRADGDHAEARVSDQGVGIPEDERPNLFQPFRRGTANERAVPGSGLGLYISAEIARRHGGQIALDSVPGQGTTVVVRLPIGDVEGDEEEAGRAAAAAPTHEVCRLG